MTTRVFEDNLTAYMDGETTIINQGGARSGKTYSILQVLFHIANASKKPLTISCVGQTMPNVKLGMLRDFKQILETYELNPDAIENKTDHIFTIGKSIIEFFSADNPGKVHGPQRDILFVNEAYFIPQEIYDALAVRTSKVKIIDFNPCSSFYVHDQIMPNNKHRLIHSTYKDNPYLSEEQVAAIESKRTNESWWRVYGLGEIGSYEGQIYTNWKIGEFDNSLPYYYGLDFGFSNDPDALIRVAIDKNRKIIYAEEMFYCNGQGFDTLLTAIKRTVGLGKHIIADSAEDRLIHDLKNKGIAITAYKKYPGCVEDGIKHIQDYQIIVSSNSGNLIKELQHYMWSNKGASIPIDSDNHLLDALRYVVMQQIQRPVTLPGKTKVM